MYRVYAKEFNIIRYIQRKNNCKSWSILILLLLLLLFIYLTLGASPALVPPSERGKLLAAENRKKIGQAARRLDTSRLIDIQKKNNKNWDVNHDRF